jgi:hypothetical protein
MAYSEELAERVRAIIGGREAITEKKMFGGLAWMLAGNMACALMGRSDGLLVRVPPEEYEATLGEPHVGPMDMGARVMTGFVIVDPAALADEAGLARWVDRGADYAASLPSE